MAPPRPGGFCYSVSEYRVLRRDADAALSNGADGVAFGVLTDSGEIDAQHMHEIVRQIGPRQAVFHRRLRRDARAVRGAGIAHRPGRAPRPDQRAGGVGVPGVAADPPADRPRRGHIEILPAAGVNRFGATDPIIARTGCDQVHASLRASHPTTRRRPGRRCARQPTNPPDDRFDATSAELGQTAADVARRPVMGHG